MGENNTPEQAYPASVADKDDIAAAKGEHVEEIGHAVTVEDHEQTVFQAIRTQPWAFAWCLYAIYVLILTSFDNQAGGTVIGIPQFRKDFGSFFEGDYVLPAKWQSAYSGAPVASAVIGSLGAGYVADRIGRKWTYFISYIFIFVGITLETISTTNEIFFAGKLIAGFPIGAFITVSMTYIGEVAPLALRGIMTAAAAIAFTIGPFIVSLVVNETGAREDRWAYRTIFVSQYGVSGLGALFLFFMPESPWWLVNKGKMQKAARSLARLGYDAVQVEKRISVIALTLAEVRKETEGASFAECFRKSNLRRTIISVAPLSIQALCGVFFVASYATYYQQIAGYTPKESFKLAIVQQVLSMLGNITAWFLIDRVGRRGLTLWGMCLLTVLLMITGGLAVAGTPGAVKGTVALLLVYCYIYNVTIGATAYSLLTEVATSRLRAKTAAMALALQNSLFTMWAFVIPFLFNPDQANLGAKVSFIFGGLSVLSTIYLWFYQPEVAGRSYEELDEMFIKKIPAREFKSHITEVQKSQRLPADDLGHAK
ncbi:MFS hexose transporter [Colletotrichum higginsianum]|uniref:MFS hexose transporter n=2 Tax=Colletotrichum higginsianum TaxID=80884 RepID=H1UYF4_COLHI|nr:MFS hexose transporter [Colletotrichum higginsianum IMI 349063]OBR03179.1 MFS hexose transporter [Colletotrichum higginsianum IMI 349063]TIC89943.1 Alpha-glucosides permease MPH3 [Colletotrichum higginsianum]GJD02472.1 MFS hexose transporter [Colletotrichum higginsianum]CCF33005.1 MFS hexose transporter [Colletotrichum higginsianum]